METNTQTPPRTELMPRAEDLDAIDMPTGAEVAVPPSAEVMRYEEAQQRLEQDGIQHAGYEIAIPVSNELVPYVQGEVVPVDQDRLPDIRDTVNTLATQGGEMTDEQLEQSGIVRVAEQYLGVEGSEEPERDTLLFLEGQEAEKPYAVKVGKETRIMGVIELVKYLVSVKESMSGVSVIDAKGNVLMHANGEIAEAIAEDLQSTYLGRTILKIAGVELKVQKAQVEYGTFEVTQETVTSIETPVAAEPDHVQTDAIRTNTAPASAALATDPVQPQQQDSASDGAMPETAQSTSKAPGTEMAMYEGERGNDSSNSEATQNVQEAGPAAITSGEDGRLAAEAIMQDLFPDGFPTNKEGQRRGAEKVKSRLAKEGVHPDRNAEDASAAYNAVNEKLNF